MKASKRAWRSMVDRCHNPSDKGFRFYGARGVAVCPAWRASYETFASDVGPRPSSKHMLDRIDNERGYEPGNVRWATATENNRNRRNTVQVTALGRTMTIGEWAEETGLSYALIAGRLFSGWAPDAAVTEPAKSPVVNITYEGRTMPLQQWAAELGISKGTLWNRVRKFRWPLERALVPGDQRENANRKAG